MTNKTRFVTLFLVCFSVCCAAQVKGYALLVGASRANPVLYDPHPVAKADADADSMKSILTEAGFDDTGITSLKGKDATIKNILKSLDDYTKKVKKGDMFVFYFSGHGDTVTDKNHDELPYTFDQQFVVADGWIIDDTLFHFFRKFPDSVRLVFIADACFSGEMYKFFDMMLIAGQGPVNKLAPKTAALVAESVGSGCFANNDKEPFNMIYVGAADKDRLSIALSDGSGVLTHWICTTWRYMKMMNYLDGYTMLEFFREACNSSTETIITNVQKGANDIFGKKPAFKL
jgi:hypothetical protein